MTWSELNCSKATLAWLQDLSFILFTIGYTTAGLEGAKNGEGFAGQESDVFVLPTFSIIYRYVFAEEELF